MPILSEDQKKHALEIMHEYLDAKDAQGMAVWDADMEMDEKRISLIREDLGPLVSSYLAGNVPLADFRTRIDSLNKKNEYWGFKGIKGQMFFNMILNVSEDETETDLELKAALAVPANDEMAKSRLRTFMSYVRRAGDEYVEAGGTKRGRPKIGSAPFFLSYFWQIQAPATWPVFYTNSANVMSDLNLWQPTDDPAADYISFKQVHEELAEIFTGQSGRKFGLYEVEHVFWFKGGSPHQKDKAAKTVVASGVAGTTFPHASIPALTAQEPLKRLPDSYVPPIISILSQLATNDPSLLGAASASGTSIPRAFEKSIDAAFTVMGYESKLLGQGQGRVPDGVAQDRDNSYAVIWDAKVRTSGYSMGTDDRTIREYIATQSRELKRKRSFRNIYYAIVSSGFQEDHDNVIRELKMETEVAEVILLEADALVAMVEAKLRYPLDLSLGSDGIQRLFSSSGIVTVDMVRVILG